MMTYLDRARQAAASAREMRDSSDHNGACNRAYYAVFYAMGLLELAGDENPWKTHASLLRRFSERFVLSGEASPEVGRALTVAHNLRAKADYSLAGASDEDSADALATMQRILDFAEPRLKTAAQGERG